jgi:hypothetical protein
MCPWLISKDTAISMEEVATAGKLVLKSWKDSA